MKRPIRPKGTAHRLHPAPSGRQGKGCCHLLCSVIVRAEELVQQRLFRKEKTRLEKERGQEHLEREEEQERCASKGTRSKQRFAKLLCFCAFVHACVCSLFVSVLSVRDLSLEINV